MRPFHAKHHGHRGLRNGFTLVEIMVALAIVSIVVFTLLLSSISASRDAFMASRYRTARMLAEEIIGEVKLGIIQAEVGTIETGTFERDDPERSFEDVLWEVTVNEKEWEINTPNDDPYALDAEEEREPIRLRDVRVRTWFEGFEGDPEGEIELHVILPWSTENPLGAGEEPR